MRPSVLIGSYLLLAAGCAPAPRQLTDADRQAIGDTLLAKTQAVAEGGSKVDVQATFRATSTSASFRAADNGTLMTHDELLAAFTKGFANLQKQDIQLTNKHVVVLTPDIGVVSASGVFTQTDKKGKTSPSTPFAWTLVWVRENGEWKWVNGHESFVAADTK